MKSESLVKIPWNELGDLLEKLHSFGLTQSLARATRFNDQAVQAVVSFLGMFSQHQFPDSESSERDKFQSLFRYWRELERAGFLPPNSYRCNLDPRYVGYDVSERLYYDQTNGMPWSKEKLNEMSHNQHIFFEMLLNPDALLSLMKHWPKVCQLFDCPCQLEIHNFADNGLLADVDVENLRKFLTPRMGIGGWRAISTIPDEETLNGGDRGLHSLDKPFDPRNKRNVYALASGAEIIIRDLIGYLTSGGKWPSDIWSCDFDLSSEGNTFWFFKGDMNGLYQIKKTNLWYHNQFPGPWTLVKSRVPGR